MTVELAPQTEAMIAQLATEQGFRSPEALVEAAIALYLAHREEEYGVEEVEEIGSAIAESDAQFKRGQFTSAQDLLADAKARNDVSS